MGCYKACDGWHRSKTREREAVTIRLIFSYIMYWQLHGATSTDEPRCRLCNDESKPTFVHTISVCHVIEPIRPPNMRYKELCDYFISFETLEDIIIL